MPPRSSHQVVNHPEPEPKPSSPSLLPAPQPVDSQESIDLGDVAGDDKQANVRANNPDAIRMLKPGAVLRSKGLLRTRRAWVGLAMTGIAQWDLLLRQ